MYLNSRKSVSQHAKVEQRESGTFGHKYKRKPNPIESKYTRFINAYENGPIRFPR